MLALSTKRGSLDLLHIPSAWDKYRLNGSQMHVEELNSADVGLSAQENLGLFRTFN